MQHFEYFHEESYCFLCSREIFIFIKSFSVFFGRLKRQSNHSCQKNIFPKLNDGGMRTTRVKQTNDKVRNDNIHSFDQVSVFVKCKQINVKDKLSYFFIALSFVRGIWKITWYYNIPTFFSSFCITNSRKNWLLFSYT